MKSWAHAVKGLKPDFVAKVDEVVSRRTRLKREFEQATEEEIALIQEVQAMNLRPKNSGENTGKLDADMVAAMDRDVFFAYAKRGPAPRKSDQSAKGRGVKVAVLDTGLDSSQQWKPLGAEDMRELIDKIQELAGEMVAAIAGNPQADQLRKAVDRTAKELEDDPIGLKLALDGMPKKYNPDDVQFHIGPLAEYLNNNVDARQAARSSSRSKHKDH